MVDDRLTRIEGKLDGLVTGVSSIRAEVNDVKAAVSGVLTELADLRSTATELTVGQATTEHRFERTLESMSRHLSSRVDDHERRLKALETRR
jgi:hypothetical protein